MQEAGKQKVVLTHQDIQGMIGELANEIVKAVGRSDITLYPIPRGGIPVAYLLKQHLPGCFIVDSPSKALVFVDDLIDSGDTMNRYKRKWGCDGFFALIDKKKGWKGKWIVFPWEHSEEKGDESATDCIVRLLQYIGEDPTRGGLLETPKRVLKAWKEEWASGYGKDPVQEMKTFEDGAEKYDEMVLRKDIPFFSHCEHHLAPFFGTITVGYLPNKKVLGLSKLDRVVEVYARRLQVQERLTVQIADAITQGLDAKGVGVIVKARHLCIESRGVHKHNSETVTSALRGMFLDSKVRSEFLSIAQ